MNLLHRFEHWGDTHHPRWMDFVRIALGLFLFYKGIHFLMNMSVLHDLMDNKLSFGSFAIVMVGHYVVFAHLIGGICLVLGVLTRAACIIQIPILLGAIILVNFAGDVWRPYSEMIVSIIVLLLLVYFLIAGNGPLSFKVADDEMQGRHKY